MQCAAQPCEAGGRRTHGYCDRHYQRWRKYGDPYHAAFTYLTFDSPDLELHFWNHATVTANPTKCWEWQGDADEDGYGRIRVNGQRFRAHRLAFFFGNGRHPADDLLVLHSCDNPRCINPDHLREGTVQNNHDDMYERNRAKPPKGESHYRKNRNLGVEQIYPLLRSWICRIR